MIEENRHRLFLRITSISRFRKRSVIVQKYTQYCHPKLFYDRFSTLLTVWTAKTKKIFCFYRAETIKHLDVIETATEPISCYAMAGIAFRLKHFVRFLTIPFEQFPERSEISRHVASKREVGKRKQREKNKQHELF